jgi:hypothetical protein
VCYKLKRLKGKYLHAAFGAFARPHERRVRDLCASVWGADLKALAGDDERTKGPPPQLPTSRALSWTPPPCCMC